MVGCTLYAFSKESGEFLRLSASQDGQNFKPLQAKIEDFSEGEGEYGYLKPIRYTVDGVSEKASYLKIDFTGPANLSRVEIRYKK